MSVNWKLRVNVRQAPCPSQDVRGRSGGIYHAGRDGDGGRSRIPFLLCGLCVLAVLVAGCKTKSNPPPPGGWTAYPMPPPAGVPPSQPGVPQAPPQQPAYVTVRGLVRNPVVPWTEDLTLSQALLHADYYGFGDPRDIFVVRQGISYPVDPRDLLKGRSDGPLLPGDIVVIR